ncbi:MAG: 2-C-methyl-D-erythritol 4-phosphate cytidylyltransferase [Nocardioidaceae bacterium]|nr:2-C-methyl-D-erythritol 4-phosphate cytidylyltransferase [Nocardioidaceae bacterium]
MPVEGRGSLPFALVHGESLVAAASWAVGEAGCQLYDASVPFDAVRRSGRDLLLHDPLCPLTPAGFLAEAAARARETGRVVVAFREVTDTIKGRTGDRLGETVDRAGLRTVVSPVVVPGPVLAGLEVLDAGEFPVLVGDLATRAEIEWLEAPALARRVHDLEELAVLEALSRSQSG